MDRRQLEGIKEYLDNALRNLDSISPGSVSASSKENIDNAANWLYKIKTAVNDDIWDKICNGETE